LHASNASFPVVGAHVVHANAIHFAIPGQ
jgi:hypothetical protein